MSNPIIPSQFVVGSVYNLTMAVPAIHGTTMDNMKLAMVMEYDEVIALSPVDATHASVKALASPEVAASLPLNVETSLFYKFRANGSSNTQPVYLAADWITSGNILSTIIRNIRLQIDSPTSEVSLKHILTHLNPKVTILSYT